jgi:hypothetical protein
MTVSAQVGQPWLYLDPARAIEQLGDVQALLSMLPMLQELLDRDVPQIAQFLAAQDVKSANPLLHSLKGCMPIFCAADFCEELAHVEHMSKTAGIAEVGPAFSVLGPKLDHLKLEVSQFLTAQA